MDLGKHDKYKEFRTLGRLQIQPNVGYPGNSKDLGKFGIFGKLENLWNSQESSGRWEALGNSWEPEPCGTLRNSLSGTLRNPGGFRNPESQEPPGAVELD